MIGGAGVPDGGWTVSLLGRALLGLTALRRKWTAKPDIRKKLNPTLVVHDGIDRNEVEILPVRNGPDGGVLRDREVASWTPRYTDEETRDTSGGGIVRSAALSCLR